MIRHEDFSEKCFDLLHPVVRDIYDYFDGNPFLSLYASFTIINMAFSILSNIDFETPINLVDSSEVDSYEQ